MAAAARKKRSLAWLPPSLDDRKLPLFFFCLISRKAEQANDSAAPLSECRTHGQLRPASRGCPRRRRDDCRPAPPPGSSAASAPGPFPHHTCRAGERRRCRAGRRGRRRRRRRQCARSRRRGCSTTATSTRPSPVKSESCCPVLSCCRVLPATQETTTP